MSQDEPEKRSHEADLQCMGQVVELLEDLPRESIVRILKTTAAWLKVGKFHFEE